MPVGSSMLKLGKEIESVECQSCSRVFFHIPFCCHCFLIYMKENDDPLFMESGWLVFEMEGRQALYLRVNRFPFWITKSSESSASRIV